MIDVAAVALGRHRHRRTVELGPVGLGQTPPRRRGGAELRQPGPEDRRLQLVEAAVHAALVVVVAARLPAVAEPAQAIGERAIVGGDRAAVAQRAQVLGRVEAERRGGRAAADRPTIGRGQVRLTGVLDDRESMTVRHPADRRHVGRLAVEMDRDDGLGTRGHRRRHRVRRRWSAAADRDPRTPDARRSCRWPARCRPPTAAT